MSEGHIGELVLSEAKEVRPLSNPKSVLRITVHNWWVYIIQKSGKFYTGITTDLDNRMRQHGKSAPAYTEGPMSRTDAASRERQIKKWTRDEKMQLILKRSGKLR